MASAIKFEGAYWMCKMCKQVKETLLNGESVVVALANIEARSLEEIKNIVGLVVYESGNYIQITLLPIIGEVEFQLSENLTKPEARESYAMVFDNMCTMKNKEAVSAERVQLFSQVGYHDPGVLLDTMYR
jgi:hypothetical protein